MLFRGSVVISTNHSQIFTIIIIHEEHITKLDTNMFLAVASFWEMQLLNTSAAIASIASIHLRIRRNDRVQ